MDFLSLHLLDSDRVRARIHNFCCYHIFSLWLQHFFADNYDFVIIFDNHNNLLGR